MSDQSMTGAGAGTKPALTISGNLVKAARSMAPLLVWIAVAFAGAGRLDWVRGWICAAVYLPVMTITGVLMNRFNPGLLEAREKWRYKDTPQFDKLFAWAYLPLVYIQVLAAGLDAVRFRAMPMAAWTIFPGVAVFLTAMALVSWTFFVNPFAEARVRLQSDRGHAVVSAGPYRIMRHPMYVGLILLCVSTALMFSSGWAMIVAAPLAMLILWRTGREDRFLQDNLPGYREYAAETRYRLIPGLW